MNPTLEEYVAYGVKALQDRRKALMDNYNKAVNPLDRLAAIDKINELDICAQYFADYAQFVTKPEDAPKHPAPKAAKE